jgi:hypothetical protein
MPLPTMFGPFTRLQRPEEGMARFTCATPRLTVHGLAAVVSGAVAPGGTLL